MDCDEADLRVGARNLLLNCAEVSDGSSVLILREPAGLGYYDDAIAGAIADVARGLVADVEVMEIPFDPVVTDPGPVLAEKMGGFDCTIFFARLGDQLRFRPSARRNFSIMSYALDVEMLASDFGRADYRAFVRLKALIDNAFAQAAEIHVTCPQGTDFRGPGARFPSEGADTAVKRFPLSVFAPIPPVEFSGRIAQLGFLAPTGSQRYEPPACEIRDKIFVNFEGHSITGIDGNARDVAAVRRHYTRVATRYGLERDYIHSWHAGIHPGCAYRREAMTDIDRWSNGAFGNPRVLHFHTCGTEVPGEISLNVIDPTVRIDGVAVWEDGILHPQRLPGDTAWLEADLHLKGLFENPARKCGLGAEGRLSYR